MGRIRFFSRILNNPTTQKPDPSKLALYQSGYRIPDSYVPRMVPCNYIEGREKTGVYILRICIYVYVNVYTYVLALSLIEGKVIKPFFCVS